ncbi:hypothetical protein GDO86_019196 [Hymenochirus boettgeri]|uniref:Uncharacterized protein n=1 Tax=Hymenochirus boettgeri TaxID=247094 RepID=A0A8T2IGV1_9PIPI|nr:hypothetical protein GDO86_019196 [Hymenochirus boettgeri]
MCRFNFCRNLTHRQRMMQGLTIHSLQEAQ